VGLVVDGVEGRDHVEAFTLTEVGGVAKHEADVGRAGRLGVGLRLGDAALGHVESGEATGREGRGQQVQRPAAAAADVRHVDAGLEALGAAGQQRHDLGQQRALVALAGRLRHQSLEARVAVVGDAAAVAEGLDDLVLDLAQQADVLAERGEVQGAGGPGEQPGVLGGRW